MTFLSSLDAKDRRLLFWCLGAGLVLSVAIALLLPDANGNSDPLPSSYLTGQHGARAAYETLVRSNYPIERWERPLAELAATSGPDTVVIFAEPLTREPRDLKAVREILERGGRILATGFWGGFILPGEAGETPDAFTFAACRLEPEGLNPLAAAGEVWMIPRAGWQVGNPAFHVDYTCAGQPAVVEYNWGKGHAVWWASSTPLENGSIARAHDLDLLLASLGPRAGHHFYWDESLHGEIRSTWSYASGPAWNLLWIGLTVLGLLVVLSFSRRTGPVRGLPAPVRATPIEFLDALGSLYKPAGAASTAVTIAFENFRRRSLRLCGLPSRQMDAVDLAGALRRRFPQADKSLEADLAACEEAGWAQAITPGAALKLIQRLHSHQDELEAVAKRGNTASQSSKSDSNQQERAS